MTTAIPNHDSLLLAPIDRAIVDGEAFERDFDTYMEDLSNDPFRWDHWEDRYQATDEYNDNFERWMKVQFGSLYEDYLMNKQAEYYGDE